MNLTPFKTPLPHATRQNRPERTSDSEESVTSEDTNDSGSSNGEISLVAEFDELMRFVHHLKCENVDMNNAFLDLLEQMKLLNNEFESSVVECRRLQEALDNKTMECADYEAKLKKARRLLDKEKSTSRSLLRDKDDLLKQIGLVKDLLFKDDRTSAEVKNKLSFLQNNQTDNVNGHLSAIKEVNSTGSILSDFSFSKSEDDLDESLLNAGKYWKKHRPSSEGVAEPAVKKRRSSGNKTVEIGATDTVRATTTVTVSKDGPIMATSIIESVPKLAPESSKFSAETLSNGAAPVRSSRRHTFQQKTVVMPDTCGPCERRIRFGKTAMKCKDCKAICHVECVDKAPVPCIPVLHTPNRRNALGVIGDYTPTFPPMVPALLIHCINEIELRGLNEIGLYRIPGSERDVKLLKEKFLRNRGAPCLNNVDVHVICGTVKDFLRSLSEPIVTYALWKKFVQAVELKDSSSIVSLLRQLIMELPQPNRDTLAYIILHLKKVAESKDCKMNSSNLAKVFGPTIVGYSSENPDDLLLETRQQNAVMEHLINIDGSYWSTFVNVENNNQYPQLQQTPSTDSLLRSTTTRGFFTPNRSMMKRKQKYFASPKN